MAGVGRSHRESPPATARLALLVAAAAVATAMAGVMAEGKAVRVEEPHRRSMLANGLGSAPPMGWVTSDLKHRAPSFFFPRFCSSRDLWCVVRAPSILAHGVDP